MLSDQQVISEATRIVSQNPLGLLTTVDARNSPHARWMGVAAVDGVHQLFTISGKAARKVEHIRRNPAVCWVFHTPEHEDVITLMGEAEIQSAAVVTQAAWDRLIECARDYAMGPTSDDANLECVTIRTLVRQIELISPRLRIFHPRLVELPLR